MLPRLQARAQLRIYEAVAAGSGQMKRAAGKRWLADLQGQARAKRERAVKASTADLAAMGITVEDEEVKS